MGISDLAYYMEKQAEGISQIPGSFSAPPQMGGLGADSIAEELQAAVAQDPSLLDRLKGLPGQALEGMRGLPGKFNQLGTAGKVGVGLGAAAALGAGGYGAYRALRNNEEKAAAYHQYKMAADPAMGASNMGESLQRTLMGDPAMGASQMGNAAGASQFGGLGADAVADLPPEVKATFMDRLRGLPGQAGKMWGGMSTGQRVGAGVGAAAALGAGGYGLYRALRNDPEAAVKESAYIEKMAAYGVELPPRVAARVYGRR